MIAKTSGIVINVIYDGEDQASEYEILVGGTNRHTDAEITAMGENLSATDAVIKNDGKKILVFVL